MSFQNEIRGRDPRPGSLTVMEMLDLIYYELRQNREEVKQLADQDAALTQVVTDLASAFDDNTTAIEAEIAKIQSSVTPGDDPVVDTAITNLQTLVATMKASTAAAQAAIAPPASNDAPAASTDPAPDSGAADNSTTE